MKKVQRMKHKIKHQKNDTHCQDLIITKATICKLTLTATLSIKRLAISANTSVALENAASTFR